MQQKKPPFRTLLFLAPLLVLLGWSLRAEEAARKSAPDAKGESGKQEKVVCNKTPEQALQAMKLADGFKVSLFASEPDVRQPNAFCVDDRGRLWVGENYTYSLRGWQPDARDRILIFEDTDNDGTFDKRKVFTDDFTYVSGLEVGHGGVWVGSPPNLLFIPDRNQDDVPDGKPEVVLDGWGRQDQHETLNTFTWGPDGWLYGCHGVFTHSRVGKPGTPDAERTPINAGVWRYHPVRQEFEVFAWGTSNPWGIAFNDQGQMVITACVIPHLWHIIQGGRYRRQAGRHFNKHVYGDIKTIAKHTHIGLKGRKAGHAHGGALFYLGDSFPDRYRNQILMCNIHHNAMYWNKVERSGSGYEGSFGSELMAANDPWFIGFSIRPAHDGSVYVIDWYDSRVCHGQTPEGKTTGRIYKISYGEKRPPAVNLAGLSDAKLVELQLHRNDWYVQHARRLLAERATAGKNLAAAHAELEKILRTHPDVTRKLRALWALHCSGGTNEALLAELLASDNEYLRAWAIQLEMEDKAVSDEVLAQYVKLATNDPSQLVRLYLASALQRLPLADRWDLAAALVSHTEDENDHNLPLMIWYGIEPLVPLDKVKALRLTTKTKITLLRKFIAQRAAQ